MKLRRRMPSTMELVAFESAARHGSFTRAAEELDLTQGAVSRQIERLEETLGVALFARVRQRVSLTEAGRLYLTEARRAIVDLEAAGERVAAFGGGAVFNLAVLPTFGTRWLMARVPQFLAGAGAVRINFYVRLEPFSFDALPFDAAIHFGQDDWPGTRARFLCKEEMIAVASPALADRERLKAPDDLRRAILLHQSTRPGAWGDWFAAQGMAPSTRPGHRFDQFGMILAAAIAGMGVALAPRFLMEEDLAAGRLIELGGAPIWGERAYWYVTPDRREESALVSGFGDWLAGLLNPEPAAG